jgi:hypothetical protein
VGRCRRERSLGDRLGVGRQVLALVAGVRILLPQPTHDTAPSSRGPGHGPLKAETRVRIPLGPPLECRALTPSGFPSPPGSRESTPPGYRRESVVAPSNFATLARRWSVHTGTGRKQLNQSRCNARRRVEETERQLSRISANRAPSLRSRGLVPRRTEDRHRRLRRTRFACPSPRRCVGAHRTPGVKGRDRRCG